MRMRRIVIFALLLAALFLISCGERKPSVILISIDSLRVDAAFGGAQGKPIAPRIAQFADQSLVFEQAISPAPWTTPAMMAVLTGHSAPAHGVEKHYQSLSKQVPTLAERFRQGSYRTAAFTPAVTLRAEYGFDRGFEVFDYHPYGHDKISSPQLSGKVIHQMEKWKQEPFFIWVHLWDPHYNYNPPPPYDEAFPQGEEPASHRVQCLKWVKDPVTPEQALFLEGLYWGEVSYTDRYFGAILDAVDRLGLGSKTIIAVLADHGEGFLEHHWLGHTNRLDEALIHVPLLLRYSGHLTAEKQFRTVSTAQVGATLLELAGLPPEGFGSLPGLPLEEGEGEGEGDKGEGAVSETLRRGCLTSLTRGGWRYVIDHRTCEERLFNLKADPPETCNRVLDRPQVRAEMRESLRRRLERIGAMGIPRASLPPEVIEESETRLRSLGYMGAGGGARRGDPTVCDGVVFSGPRDSLGDLEPRECPSAGALGCLEKIRSARGQQQP